MITPPRSPLPHSLPEAHQWHAAIVAAALDCIITMDAEGRVVEFNPAAERVFGYSRADACGREMAELIVPPRFREQHRAGLARLLATGEVHLLGKRIEIEGMRADGTEFPLELTITRLDMSGQPLFTAFIRDLTAASRAEAALRASESKFKQLFEKSADAILLLDQDLIVDCNRGAVAMMHCRSREELLKLHPSGISPPTQPDGRASFEKANEMIALALATGSHRFEWMHRRADGDVFPADVLLTVIDLGGRQLLYGVFRDITDLKRTEAALRASEVSYRAIFNASTDAIYIHDVETGAILDVNRKACEVLGYSVEELRELGVEALIPGIFPFTAEAALERLRAAAAGEPQRFEWLNRNRAGEQFWSEVNLERTEISGVDRLLATARDVTERKRAESELRERADRVVRYQAALMDLTKSDLSDFETATREVTEKDARTLGVERVSVWFFDEKRSAIVCRDLYEAGPHRHSAGTVLEAASFPRYFEALSTFRTIAAHEAASDPATSEFAEIYLRPLGITSMLDVPIWRHGRMIGVVCHEHTAKARHWKHEEQVFASSIADVIALALEASERRQAEQEVGRAQASLERRVEERTAELGRANEILRHQHLELERANRAKSEFLSRMSHELRTPMNSILGFGQVLARKITAEDQRKHVQHILDAGRHLLELINEVLDISRIEADQLRLSSEPVALTNAVQEAMTLVQHLALERAVEVRHDLQECEVFVMADRQRLMQVLVNLLSNGVKYNRRGGLVTITCLAIGEQAHIAVSDNGRGIPADMLDRLFSPFDRLGAEDSEVEGTGLGLTLSKRLVEHMGGMLRVTSKVGVGTDFWIELPLAEDPRTGLRTRRDGPSDRGSGLAGRKRFGVLYIEDNLANVSLVETILADVPAVDLLVESRGEAGIARALETLPALILLDMHLPDQTGEQVLQRLKSDPRTARIPVIIVSADATASHIKAVLASGASHYLTKPLDVDRFLAVVEATLRPND